MKIERQLKILFYVLNRECVSANTLAEEFGVSRRTILRDINDLTLAGIPIYSEIGSKGGYSIQSNYKINEKIIDDDNSKYMLLALKSLKDIYGDKKVKETYEKVKHILKDSIVENMLEIDLSVINENDYVVETIDTLKNSIQKHFAITFNYTNSQNKSSKVKADVLHVFYRWYSWYVFAYNRDNKNFCMYKIVRMRNLTFTNEKWLKKYNIQYELEKYETERNDRNISVCIEYEKDMKTLVEEYFPNARTMEINNVITSEFSIKENDFMLFSIILGFGDKIKVLSPPSFALKIQKHLEKTLRVYKNSDK